MKQFRKKHEHIYGSGITGGWRTRATHFHPIWPVYEKERPTPESIARNRILSGDSSAEEYEESYEEEDADNVSPESKEQYRAEFEWIAMGPIEQKLFYFDDDAERTQAVIDLLEEHLGEIGTLMGQCEGLIRAAYPPPKDLEAEE